MEEVCLNSEPVFEDGDDCELNGGSSAANHDRICEYLSKNEPSLPTVGLEFESFENAYDFYNIYAKEQGFGIRVCNSWSRSITKERYRAKLCCSNAGFKKKSEANNPRPETRTGCPALIVIRLLDSDKWRIVEVELQHNHTVGPQINRVYKSHKKMTIAAQKAQPPPPSVTEVHTIKLYRTSNFDGSCNGSSNICEREGLNHINNSKHLELNEGDTHALYNYFCRMKLKNPNFFYSMDFDDDGRLKNVFWADDRSRAAYGYFHDTVLIDTTCLVQKYELPLISFVGVNHHGQSILLGCAFIGHESVEYFVWILLTWFKCMMWSSPQVIITDQCKLLRNAVSRVFPKACHCYNFSNIMQRVPEKLGGLKGYEDITAEMNRAVYDSLKIAEFENSWAEMIRRHGLGNIKWLHSLYEDRQKWVPVYLKDTFLAGMIPLNKNESSAPFFDGYVHKHTLFKEFLDKYDLVMHRNYLRESMADMESTNSNLDSKTKCNFETQLSKVYTKDIFKKFQSEVDGMYSCFNTKQVNVNGPIFTYTVKERVEVEGNEKTVKSYEVLFEMTQVDIRCICSLFNYRGYLCRHALNVLNYNGIEEIPLRYILSRWDKDFKQRRVVDHGVSSIDLHNRLCKSAIPIAEAGAQSQERYEMLLVELEELLNKFDVVDHTV